MGTEKRTVNRTGGSVLGGVGGKGPNLFSQPTAADLLLSEDELARYDERADSRATSET